MTRLLAAVVHLFVGLAEVVLILRIVFRLFAANSNQFVVWIYDTSDQLLQPFRGIFPVHQISGGHVLDFTALFGMLVYALLGAVLVSVLKSLKRDKHKLKKKSKE